MSLTSFDLGKLKIAGHVREELERFGIAADSIQCKSGGMLSPPDIARLTVTVDGTSAHVDFRPDEVEDCEFIVAGDAWYKIAGLIDRLRNQAPVSGPTTPLRD